jgi:hypothetical protein
MEIKAKIEETSAVQSNNIPLVESPRVNALRTSEIGGGKGDFSSYLKTSDAKKIDLKEETQLEEDKRLVEETNLAQQAAAQQQILPQAKKEEIAKALSQLAEQEPIIGKINNIQEIKLFLTAQRLSESKEKADINLDKFSKEDIDFFKTCLENPAITFNPQNLQSAIAIQAQNGQVSYKSLDVSKTLFNLMEYSFKAQKPVRLDFSGNSSVILKMHNNGKLVAEFVSNDAAMEYTLKTSLPYLKDKLDSEGIDYEEISYKDNSREQRNNKRQNQGGNQ